MAELVAAAAQFAVAEDVEANLSVCLEAIGEAADEGADLVVLPEFCNHLSVYESDGHCREVSVELDGRFVRACAQRARRLGVYVVLSVTLRRSQGVTITSLLLSPSGGVVAQADKQMLMGNERAHLRAGKHLAPVADTPFGRIGMYSCMDGVTCEVPRALSLGGARLLANSLNSFALDEASLHVPSRAVENQVFVVAANKVGPLVPQSRMEEFGSALGIGAAALCGAGESQIVAPDGEVLSIAPRFGSCVVSARIDLDEVVRVREAFPMPIRRPGLYASLSAPGSEAPPDGGVSCSAAVVWDAESIPAALASGAALVVAAELSPIPPEIPEGVIFVTTQRRDDQHLGVAVGSDEGVILSQPQLHATRRLDWARGAGDGLQTVDLSWGRLALAVGDDIRLPEVGRLAAVAGASVLAVCHRPPSMEEATLMLAERAAENRICIVAAAPGETLTGCALLSPPADSLWGGDRAGSFDGTINNPDVRLAAEGQDFLLGAIHPGRAKRRDISKGTNLVDGRCLGAAARLASTG